MTFWSTEDWVYSVVPWNYNGAEEFLLPGDVITIVTQYIYLCGCGGPGVNKPIPLPV